MGKKKTNAGMVPAGVKHTQGKGWFLTWKTPAEIFASWQEEALYLRDKIEETQGNLSIIDVAKLKRFATDVDGVLSFTLEKHLPRSSHWLRDDNVKIDSYDFLKTEVKVIHDEIDDFYYETTHYGAVVSKLLPAVRCCEGFNPIFADIADIQKAYWLVDYVNILSISNSTDKSGESK